MRAGIISFAISGIGLGICGFLFACSMSGSKFGSSTVLGQVGLNVVIAIVFGVVVYGATASKVLHLDRVVTMIGNNYLFTVTLTRLVNRVRYYFK